MGVVEDLPRFDRRFLDSTEPASVIGSGSVGGKARGLLGIRDVLAQRLDPGSFPGIHVAVPTFAVIGTEIFDAFITRNSLDHFLVEPHPDHHIAATFQRAELPVEIAGDLWSLVAHQHTPLAVRSSSLLEDALAHPFAGVYATKMIPNNQFDPEQRFRRLVEAIKFVYASTFFGGARGYLKAVGRELGHEKMAVIIQDVVGHRHGDRFYPDLSGVARSFNHYPAGAARSSDGVVDLALGLGKTIVDGGKTWSYSPAFPAVSPPFASFDEMLDQSQREYWAINMGPALHYDPTAETEYLSQGDLAQAEEDGVLHRLVSTYDPSTDRVNVGLRGDGPRILNFAPLLVHEDVPLNTLVRRLLEVSEEAAGAEVEIEFALAFPDHAPARFGFLQVRPMAGAGGEIQVTEQELRGERVVVASERAMGPGEIGGIRHVVYVRPDTFEARHTPAIARELEAINHQLVEQAEPYLLIGFGRFGSSDPWLGIPVSWGQVAGAKVLVEATLPNMNVELSQGAHFFHNLISFRVAYLSVPFHRSPQIDWDWLASLTMVSESALVRHVVAPSPLTVRVDGRSGRGVVLRP